MGLREGNERNRYLSQLRNSCCMKSYIVRKKISKDELTRIVKENFGTMVKIDVDVERGVIAIGGEWHSEGDELLAQDGSLRKNVWGANFYPFNHPNSRIEYISLINIKPQFNNRSMEVEDKEIQEKMRGIINRLLLPDDETL